MDEEFRRYRIGQSAEYLDEVRGKALRVASLTAMIDDQRAMAEGVAGVDYSRDIVATSPTDDRMPDAVWKMHELTADLLARRDECRADVEAAHRAIGKLTAPEMAAALEMHYLAGKPWQVCARALGYTKSGIMDLRRRALDEFYDLIPGLKRVEIPEAI